MAYARAVVVIRALPTGARLNRPIQVGSLDVVPCFAVAFKMLWMSQVRAQTRHTIPSPASKANTPRAWWVRPKG